MGRTRATVTAAARASRSTRPPLARSSRRAEWDLMDPPHRCAAEGSARSLSVVPDLSSAVSQWRRTGVFEDVLQRLTEDLRDRGKLDLTEGFIDASFSSAKKGAPKSGPPN